MSATDRPRDRFRAARDRADAALLQQQGDGENEAARIEQSLRSWYETLIDTLDAAFLQAGDAFGAGKGIAHHPATSPKTARLEYRRKGPPDGFTVRIDADVRIASTHESVVQLKDLSADVPTLHVLLNRNDTGGLREGWFEYVLSPRIGPNINVEAFHGFLEHLIEFGKPKETSHKESSH